MQEKRQKRRQEHQLIKEDLSAHNVEMSEYNEQLLSGDGADTSFDYFGGVAAGLPSTDLPAFTKTNVIPVYESVTLAMISESTDNEAITAADQPQPTVGPDPAVPVEDRDSSNVDEAEEGPSSPTKATAATEVVCANDDQDSDEDSDEYFQSNKNYYKSQLDPIAFARFEQEHDRHKLVEAQNNLSELRDLKQELTHLKHQYKIANLHFKEETLTGTLSKLYKQQELVKKREAKLMCSVMREKMLRLRMRNETQQRSKKPKSKETSKSHTTTQSHTKPLTGRKQRES